MNKYLFFIYFLVTNLNANPIHDIDHKINDETYNFFVEIPAGTKQKWEVNKNTGILEWEEKEGNKTYGILSVLTQAFYDAEYLFTVKPGVFNPPPKVDSGVIRLKRKKDHSLPCDEKMFYKVVKTAFQQRRKTLRNSLKTFQLSDKLKEDAIFGQRPEQLSVQDFIELTLKLEADAISTHDRFPSEN